MGRSYAMQDIINTITSTGHTKILREYNDFLITHSFIPDRVDYEIWSFIDNPDGKNLLFSGSTGLGKTYLSNAIVSKLLEQGYTVLYQTAPVMLDTLISKLFKNDSSFSENLLNVDLLVIDDLGTETMNSMKFTELYKIVNTRLLNQNGKITKTIISTNLDLQGLYHTYDERLVSRFIGHYDIYRFFGDDIRFKIYS